MKTKLFFFFLVIAFTKCYSQTSKDHYQSGTIKYALKDYEGAITEFTKAIKLNPKWAGAYEMRGTVKQKMFDFEESIADFDTAIAINPKWVMSYTERAYSKWMIGNVKGAILDYNKAIELSPKEGFYYYGRGLLRLALSETKTDSACLDFDRAIELGYEDAINEKKEYCK